MTIIDNAKNTETPNDVLLAAGATTVATTSNESEETDDIEDEELEDDVPQDGDTLEPGYHLIELTTVIPCRQDALLAGLTRIGFQAIRLNQSRSSTWGSAPNPAHSTWGSAPNPAPQKGLEAQPPLQGPDAQPSLRGPTREHRFVANLTKTVTLHQRDVMQWRFARALSIDAGRDMRKFRLKLEAYDLEPGHVYEALFLSRERSQLTQYFVEERLNDMGFLPIKLTALQRDVRLDKRPNMSVTIWLALLEWDGPASIVTEDDPFYFEDLVDVTASDNADTGDTDTDDAEP